MRRRELRALISAFRYGVGYRNSYPLYLKPLDVKNSEVFYKRRHRLVSTTSICVLIFIGCLVLPSRNMDY